MKIYHIDSTGNYGGFIEVPDNTPGIPLGYTRTAVPEIPEGFNAVWVGVGWKLVAKPAPVDNVPVVEAQTVEDTPIEEQDDLINN